MNTREITKKIREGKRIKVYNRTSVPIRHADSYISWGRGVNDRDDVVIESADDMLAFTKAAVLGLSVKNSGRPISYDELMDLDHDMPKGDAAAASVYLNVFLTMDALKYYPFVVYVCLNNRRIDTKTMPLLHLITAMKFPSVATWSNDHARFYKIFYELFNNLGNDDPMRKTKANIIAMGIIRGKIYCNGNLSNVFKKVDVKNPGYLVISSVLKSGKLYIPKDKYIKERYTAGKYVIKKPAAEIRPEDRSYEDNAMLNTASISAYLENQCGKINHRELAEKTLAYVDDHQYDYSRKIDPEIGSFVDKLLLCGFRRTWFYIEYLREFFPDAFTYVKNRDLLQVQRIYCGSVPKDLSGFYVLTKKEACVDTAEYRSFMRKMIDHDKDRCKYASFLLDGQFITGTVRVNEVYDLMKSLEKNINKKF